MSLPIDFFVVGAQKAGTTTLHDLLTGHDDVILPRIKETHYFSHADRAERGDDWYLSQFNAPPGTGLTGEIDPEYMFAPQAAARIHARTRARNIAFVLRNPILRAYSHYLMSVRRGYDPLPFDQALLAEPERLAGPRANFAHDHWSYAARSLYYAQIQTYLRACEGSDFLFLKAEDLTVLDDASGYQQLCRFIGTAPRPELLKTRERSNTASAPRSALMRDFVYASKGKSALRQAVTSILPGPIKMRLFRLIEGANQRAITEKDETAFDNLPHGLLDAMARDVERCQALTGLDLRTWTEDLHRMAGQPV